MRARAKTDTRNATGLSPGVLLSRGEIVRIHEVKNESIAAANRPAGTRVALPGSMCGIFIPRCEAETSRQSLRSASCILASLSIQLLRAWPKSEAKNSSKRVRQHLLGLQRVRFAHLRQLFQLAHAARGLGAQDVALARVRADDLAGRRNLKAFRGAAVRLQLQLWFGCVSWHF